jgi:hypothetical protein
VVPEEQDVRAGHDGCHREHVQHHGRLSSHCFVLLCPAGAGQDQRTVRTLRLLGQLALRLANRRHR